MIKNKKENIVLKSCSEIAHKYFLSPTLILFGSRAKGNWGENSDWDVLVITEREYENKILEKFYDEIYDFELEYEIVLMPIVRSKKMWNTMQNKVTPFYKNVLKEGIIYA